MKELAVIFGIIGIACMILEEIVNAGAGEEIRNIQRQKEEEMRKQAQTLYRQYGHRMDADTRRRYEDIIWN
jgi:hypothetical protein